MTTHLTEAEVHAARIPCVHCVLKHIGQARALYCDFINEFERSKLGPFSKPLSAVILVGRSYVLGLECLKGYPQHYAFAVGLAACAEDMVITDQADVRKIQVYRAALEAALRGSERFLSDWELIQQAYASACGELGAFHEYATALGHLGEAMDEAHGLPESAMNALDGAFGGMITGSPSKHVASLLNQAAHQITGGKQRA